MSCSRASFLMRVRVLFLPGARLARLRDKFETSVLARADHDDTSDPNAAVP